MALEERSKNAHAAGVGTSWYFYWWEWRSL